jgi:hypothetical protein
MINIIGFIFGFAAGMFVFRKIYTNGVLKATYTDEKDSYTLFVDDMDKIARHKYLLLKIDKEARKKHTL